MLRSTFVHLPGIGAAKERKLWEAGIRDWGALRAACDSLYSGDRADQIRRGLDEAEQAWEAKDLRHFYQRLPREQLWRLVPGNFDDIAYLDIETTGSGMPPACHTTTITFYFRGQVLQAHEPAQKRAMVDWIFGEAKLVCTFFGEVFDVPFLRAEFGLPLDTAHLDLCFWLKRQGHAGGLKKVQKRFPWIPERQSLDINGYDAVKLWRLYRRKVPNALETLLTYNAEDTVVLEPLLIAAYNRELELHRAQAPKNSEGAPWPGLDLEPLAVKPLPELPTQTCPRVYGLLRASSPDPSAQIASS